MKEKTKQPLKRLFVWLLSLSFLSMVLFSYVIWRIAYLGLLDINENLPLVFGITLTVFVMLSGIGIVSMIGAVAGIPVGLGLEKQTYVFLNMLFPLVVFWGRIFGISKSNIEKSFIAVSNKIVHERHLKVSPEQLLVVTPHCLQLATCPHKITRDPMANCQRCGGCEIGALVSLAEEMGFHFFVVTGGTLARQTVKKIKPKMVLAVACERDLTSAIQDIYPLPAVGIMNIRPNGPCYNTHVDIELVRQEIENVLDRKEE